MSAFMHGEWRSKLTESAFMPKSALKFASDLGPSFTLEIKAFFSAFWFKNSFLEVPIYKPPEED